jgi:hypothetical protein
MQRLLLASSDEGLGPGARQLRQLVAAATGIGLGSRTASLKRLMSMQAATPFLSVLALYSVEPWVYATESWWRTPDDAHRRLSELADQVRKEFPQH